MTVPHGTPNDLLAHALKYASLGWPVHPLRGKHPLTEHGCKDAAVDASQIESWWRQHPRANIGLATGHKFWVLDVDTKSGGDLSLEELETKHGRLPDTLQQQTGTGGRHFLFALPSDFQVHNSTGKVAPGIDVRGVGGYIVAAPSIHPDTRKPYIWDGADEIESQPILAAPDWLLDRLRVSPDRQNATVIPAKIPKGQQHSTLVSIAGSMRRRGLEFDEIYAALKTINERRCTEPGPDENIRKIAESICKYPAGRQLSDRRIAMEIQPVEAPPDFEEPDPPQAPAEPPDLIRYLFNDAGNAQRLITVYGSEMRYCHAFRKWLLWDGRRWQLDETARARKMARTVMGLFYAQSGTDKETERFARKSMNEASISALLGAAESELSITPDQLDQHHYLLNCLNGMLDLKTGQLQAHQRDLYITKLCHVRYSPRAECDKFLRFLFRIMGDSPSGENDLPPKTQRLVNFIQRAFGYALTGDVSAKAVFCLFGGGNNGKTTLLEIFRHIVREYSAQISIDTLMVKPTGESSAAMADLADLRGARFVTTSEAEEGQRLNEGKLKYISAGMGEIKTCRKYENPITFKATHKLFLDANHRPIIRGVDKAIWNRLKPIPFEVEITADEIDPELLNKLKAESEGILAWAVRGCCRWLTDGLGEPDEVQRASSGWKDENDPLKDFLADSCELGQGEFCKASDLWKAYERWADDNGEKFKLSRTKFVERLELLGCSQSRRYFDVNSDRKRSWEGISVR